jgi:hypothetical protein
MKKALITIAATFMMATASHAQVLISQYVETDSGSVPKGLEIWNASGADINLSTSNIQIYQGTNGGPLTAIASTLLNTGTFLRNSVIVIGTADIGTYLTNNGLASVRFVTSSVTFNGDDSLGLYLNGSLLDTFGTVGTDPGASWALNGVNTANQNIELRPGITSVSSGWTDPSVRFQTVSTTPSSSGGLSGFGVAPVPEPSSGALLVLGGAALVAVRSLRKKNS